MSLLYTTRKDLQLERQDDTSALITGGSANYPLRNLANGVFDGLQALFESSGTLGDLLQLAGRAGGIGAEIQIELLLEWMVRTGLVTRLLRQEDQTVLRVSVFGRCRRQDVAELPAPDRLRLASFTFLRRVGDATVMESAQVPVRVELAHSDATALCVDPISYLSRPDRALTDATCQAILRELFELGLVVEQIPDQRQPEWEFHDRLFHARSRMGQSPAGFGATFRGSKEFSRPAPPLLKAAGSKDVIALGVPDAAPDPAPDFWSVLERRRSNGRHGARPLDLHTLSTFLYRTARERGPRVINGCEVGDRPYPAGGALYEIEIYPCVRAVSGLTPGVYHYLPRDHALERMAGDAQAFDVLLKLAEAAIPGADPPQVLFVLTARMDRISWKYEGLGYALVLKHVGVLFQSFYLAATALNLAPNAIGAGDPALFAAASGTDAELEPSVGELVLGTAPDS